MAKLLGRPRSWSAVSLVTGGGTGTYAVNTWVNEIQAGSYALMDSGLRQARGSAVQAPR